MVKHGVAPYLECSSRGDARFSAFRACLIGRSFTTIEEIYQSAKRFPPSQSGVAATGQMKDWRHAKGKQALNQVEVTALYTTLWREYIAENPHLIPVLLNASGLSDMFGTIGSCCQATSLWTIRQEYLARSAG